MTPGSPMSTDSLAGSVGVVENGAAIAVPGPTVAPGSRRRSRSTPVTPTTPGRVAGSPGSNAPLATSPVAATTTTSFDSAYSTAPRMRGEDVAIDTLITPTPWSANQRTAA